ncbi:MAG: ABC transporter ATP-binding protein [Chloroflexi bacterium]|nr:MAG: ABC transporter ATP-binding protein [Chloroflexota bacterium]MBL1193027.1 ABC transporter ATP-binding protein [Chloroflexota bacterium]NOH10320.1 ABC transporter ATP-binding protein [Chloroflexota bacterium]
MNHPIVIQTKDLSKSFENENALNALNLNVPQHSIFGFLGPNGAGKTTTMKLLLGLIQPSAGSGTIFGKDIVHDSVSIRSSIGYLPQEPRFYEYMTARETLAFTLRFFFKGPQLAIENRIAEMLELVGLEDKADRPIKGFSGGERQRLGIAQAQVNYPDLLILDEPAASLDPLGRRDVLEVIARLRKHTTVFYSTHILDDVQQVSDTVAILNKGNLVAQGSVEDLLAGGDELVFHATVQGDVAKAQARIKTQSWVSEVHSSAQNGNTLIKVSVTDEQAAKTNLLQLLMAGEDLVVTDFQRKSHELEDIFINIVEGEGHDN